MSALKKNDKMSELGGERGMPLTTFHSYDLDELRLPMEARPLAGDVHLGKHGYTLRSSSGAAPRSINKTPSHILLSYGDHGPNQTVFPCRKAKNILSNGFSRMVLIGFIQTNSFDHVKPILNLGATKIFSMQWN